MSLLRHAQFVTVTSAMAPGTLIDLNLPFDAKGIISLWNTRTTPGVTTKGDSSISGTRMRRGIGFATDATNRYCLSHVYRDGTLAQGATICTTGCYDNNVGTHNFAFVATSTGGGAVANAGRLDVVSLSGGGQLVVDVQFEVNMTFLLLAFGGDDITCHLATPKSGNSDGDLVFGTDLNTGQDDKAVILAFSRNPGGIIDEANFVNSEFSLGVIAENTIKQFCAMSGSGISSGDDRRFKRWGNNDCCLTMIDTGMAVNSRIRATAWTSQGVTLDFVRTSGSAVGGHIVGMAIKGGRWKIGSLTTEAAGSLQAATPVVVGHLPKFLLFLSSGSPNQAVPSFPLNSTEFTNHGTQSIGIMTHDDGQHQWCYSSTGQGGGNNSLSAQGFGFSLEEGLIYRSWANYVPPTAVTPTQEASARINNWTADGFVWEQVTTEVDDGILSSEPHSQNGSNSTINFLSGSGNVDEADAPEDPDPEPGEGDSTTWATLPFVRSMTWVRGILRRVTPSAG